MEKGFGIGVAIVVLTVALVVGLGTEVALMPSSSILSSPMLPSPTLVTLPLRVGTVSGEWGFRVNFTVVGSNAELVGAWYSPHGGAILIRPANETGPILLPCFTNAPWNGTIDHSFVPGNYSMGLNPLGLGRVSITETIQLTYPDAGSASSFYFDGSSC